MALRVVGSLRKVVTAKEIRSGRIPIPARARDHVFPDLAENTHTALTMVDENGDPHAVKIKLRDRRTKPEIMSRGGRRFAVSRNLVAGAILEFSRSNLPDHFKVTVLPPLQLAPAHPPADIQPQIFHQFSPYRIGSGRRAVTELQQTEIPAALGLRGLSAQTQPPVPPDFPTFSSATAQMGFGSFISLDHPPAHSQEEPPTPMTLELGFGLSIGSDHLMSDPPKQPSTVMSLGFGSFISSDHLLGEPQKPTSTTTVMGFGLSIGSDHSMGDPPKPSSMTMELDLGLSIGPVQPPSPANTPPGFNWSVSSENMEVDPPPANLEDAHTLDLTLTIGTTNYPATPQMPELSLFGFNILQHKPHAPPEIVSGGIKSEAHEVGWHPGLSLSMGTNILYDAKFKEKMVVQDSNLKPPEAPYLNAVCLAAGHDLQELKPPTSLFSSKAGFSVFSPYVRMRLI